MIAPDFVDHLEDGQIFVAGTNIYGTHGGGAARYAVEHFGLQNGVAEGLSGDTYALPSMGTLEEIKAAADRFIAFAADNPEKTFIMSRVGCGIAGHSDAEIAPMFADAPQNIIRPRGWCRKTCDE